MVALRSWYRMIGCPQFKTEDFRVCEHGLLALAPLFVSLAAGHRQPPIPKLLLAKGRMISASSESATGTHAPKNARATGN